MITFMNQPAVAETHNRVQFMMQSGVLSFWRRPENFALHLAHHILNVTYTLDMNLCVLIHPEVSEQPQPSPPPLPICPHPIPCPSLSHYQGPDATSDTIVPLGVIFELPCPICQHSHEQGQICHYSDPHTTIIRWDHTEPLRVHQESPFVFCHHLPNSNDPTHTILLQCPINLEIHLQEQTPQMPITQLPVPKNPLPQEREVYLLVKIYNKTNFEHVEIEGVNPSLPRTLQNFHLMFTTFSERLYHVPHPFHSTWGTHVLQQKGHFQAEGLSKLETDEINRSWKVAQPF